RELVPISRQFDAATAVKLGEKIQARYRHAERVCGRSQVSVDVRRVVTHRKGKVQARVWSLGEAAATREKRVAEAVACQERAVKCVGFRVEHGRNRRVGGEFGGRHGGKAQFCPA